MGSIIYTNVQALNSQRNLKVVSDITSKASEKLSSGLRINRAGDDAAGLAISEKMRSQIKGLTMASKNSQDGISLIQTAEGALQEVQDIMQRMRELVVQAANDTNTTGDRAKIQLEVNQLISEIDATAGKTQFNKKVLLSGSFNGTNGAITFQIAANAALASASGKYNAEAVNSNLMKISIDAMTAAGLTLEKLKNNTLVNGTALITDKANDISKLISTVDKGLEHISEMRARLGAYQNRLEHTIKNLDVSTENLTAAESRIRDTDMAKEMMNFTRGNVLTQAGQSMLAQANQAPNQVLSLLQ